MGSVAIVSHEACLDHSMGSRHPEAPARLRAIVNHLKGSELGDSLRWEQPPASLRAPVRALWSQVHSPSLVHTLTESVPSHGLTWLDADTALCCDTLKAAEYAGAAVLHAVDLVSAGTVGAGFCAVRPPGHHAEYDSAMGFCFINNAALAAAYLRERYAVQRIAILDFDVHHGNGTFDIFCNDPDTLVCSSYQHPFYPGRRLDLDAGNLIYTPLEAGTRGAVALREMERVWLPALAAHRPQWIIFSAGFDAHKDDPLGGLHWDSQDFGELTRLLLGFTGEPKCQVLSLLEGGYNQAVLGESVESHLVALADVCAST
ncbi:histone deacetylase family protein [Litorivivens sp.]|uniref:histone deacetylase family protein n=1 Tax=Litorivivens sp. TaxID=2020868 RepID=UPI00356A4CEC